MNDIHEDLLELSSHLEWPITPDLTTAAATPQRAIDRPSMRTALAVAAALIAIVVIAMPAVRHQVSAFFGLGGVSIHRGTLLGPNEEVTLGVLVERSDVAFPLPAALGEPDAVRRDNVGRSWVIYEPDDDHAGALLTVFDAALEPGLTKLVADPSLQVEQVSVQGAPAYWVGGDQHFILFEGPDGSVREDRGRLSAPTLVWVSDGLTYRLESDITSTRAVEIAESTR